MSKYSENGQYELNKLSLITNTANPVELDISNIMFDMTIYESIHNETVSGNVTIVDSSNTVREYNLGNFEKINISFNTAGVDKPTIITCVCYKVSKPFRISDHSTGSTLYFASEEMFNSIRRKAFTGHNEEISNIVQKLYDRIKRVDNPKTLELSKTRNIENYVFNGNKIFDAIAILSSHATSESGDVGFVFYEDLDKFNFIALEQLYQKEPVVEYAYKNSSVFEDVQNRAEEAFNAYQDYEIISTNSSSQRMLDGEYGGSFARFSIFEKSLNTINYDVKTKFDQTKSLGMAPVVTDNDLNSDYSDKLHISYGANDATTFEPSINNRMVKLRSGTVAVSIGVFGDSTLRVGSTCKANIPNWSTNGMQPTGADRDVLTGKFLISEIKHQFTAQLYTQRLKIIKDAYEERT